jgi:putative transposase
MKEDHFKKYLHAPAHLFLTDYHYFITAGTYERKLYLDNDDKKQLLFDIICETFKKDIGKLWAWVILSNHYHILVQLKDAFRLPRIVRRIHSKCAVLLNRIDHQPGRQVWYQYWDECIRDEREFYAKLNYIHFNPVKHGYVYDPKSYRFSSYSFWLRTEGEGWLEDLLRQFPPRETEKRDGF